MLVLAVLLGALIYFYYDFDNGFCFALIPLLSPRWILKLSISIICSALLRLKMLDDVT